MLPRSICLLLAVALPSIALAQVPPQRDQCDLNALGTCARHIVEDEAAIVTSPFRMQANDLLWVVPLGLATGAAVDYDAHAMRTLGIHPKQEKDFKRFSDAGGIYVPVAGIVAGYAAGALRKDDYMKQTAVLAGESIADALILNEPLKYAINRQDPQQGDGTGRFWPHGTKTWPDGQSMPSNHSLIAWDFAHVVAARYPGWGTQLAVYSLATAISASRIMARQHFPSDVVVGGAMGYLIGGLVVHGRGEQSRAYSFSMVQTPNGPGAQLTYTFR